MKYTRLSIPDVILIEPEVFTDSRGFFMESWNEKEFKSLGINTRFLQDNHSYSNRNTLRGLHYQTGEQQSKLVRVVTGSVLDVVVDLRKSSPHFGSWVSVYLTEQNHKSLWIPPGFAHGFYVLSESTHFLYKTTEYYNPETERCILWNDPTINIFWSDDKDFNPLLSDKDSAGRLFTDTL